MKHIASVVAILFVFAGPAALAADDHKGHHPRQDQAATAHQGTGVIKSVDTKGKKVSLAHDPIASLKWPAMTMDLAVSDAGLLAGLRPGAKVEFELKPGEKGQYVISAIRTLK